MVFDRRGSDGLGSAGQEPDSRSGYEGEPGAGIAGASARVIISTRLWQMRSA